MHPVVFDTFFPNWLERAQADMKRYKYDICPGLPDLL